MRRSRGAWLNPGLAVGAALMLAACSSGHGPLHSVAVTTGFGTKEPEPAEFVKASRRPDATYLPVGVSAPARTAKPRSATEAKALEEQLEAQRKANEAAAGAAKSLSTMPAVAPGQAPTN